MDSIQRVFEVPKNNLSDVTLNILVEFNKHAKTLLVKLLDQTNNAAWQCELNDGTARQYYNIFEMSPDDYWEDIEQPMQSATSSYQYWIQANKFSLKKLVDNDVVLEFFKLHIAQICPDDLKSLMLSVLIKTTTNLEQQNKDLVQENVQLKTQRDSFNIELDTLTQTKTHMEDEMLSKFVQILNAKKEKIVQLEKKVSEQNKRRKVAQGDDVEIEVDEPDTPDEDNGAYDQDTDKEEEQDDPIERPQYKASTSFSSLMDM